MKIKQLIGLHCRTDCKLGPTGTVKDIVKSDEVGFNGKPIWEVIIEDPLDGDIEKRDITEVIFEIPFINKWEFEYLNSSYEIDGDEKFNKDILWLDSKISKEDVIKMITSRYAGTGYFSLRNLKIIDQQTIDWQINYD